MRRYSSVCVVALGIVGAGTATAATDTAAQEDYVITDLGAGFKPRSISENGHIVGEDSDRTARRLSTTYNVDNDRNVTVTVEENVPLETPAQARAVNQQQLIAGFREVDAGEDQPLVWQASSSRNDLETFSNITQARGLNEFDEIVGTRLIDGFERPFWFDYTSGTLKTLSTLGGARGWANDINNAGQVIGTAHDENGNPIGFIYDESRTDDEVSDVYKSIGTLDGFTGSEAVTTNDNEDIVGWVFTGESQSPGKRAILSPIGNSLVNLGTLNHDVDSVANGINNNGQIVGRSTWADGTQRAFIYDLSETDLLVVKADPKKPNRVYMASTKGAGIFRSENRGDTWTEINRGLTNLNIQDVVIHPRDNNILYAAAQNAIFKSENAGQEWRSIGPEMEGRTVYAIHINTGDDNLVLAGTNGGMYYSRDGGESWTLFRRADSEGNEDIIGVFDFIETPNQPNRMFAATDSGVYRIDIDGGSIDWSSQNGEGDRKLTKTYITALAIPPQSQDRLFAATSGGGVWSASLREGFLRWEQRANGMNPLVSSIEFLQDENLYAGTTGGLFFSSDYGLSWSAVSAFGSNRKVYTLSIYEQGADTTTLYATTNDGAVLRSDNNNGLALGSEWTAVTRGVDPPDVYVLISAPDDPNTIETDPQIYLGASSGAYRWDQENLAWAAAANSVKNTKVTALAADTSTTPTTLWAGSPDNGIFKSVDGGNNWSTVNKGLTHWSIRALAVDNDEIQPIVYAATMGGVYRSDDGGDNWAPSQSGMGGISVYSLLLDTSVFPRALYAGTADGVFRSVDSGRNWVKLNAGMEGVDIVDLKKDFHSNILYAASTAGNLYKSTDYAASWTAINPDNSPGLGDATIYSIAIDDFAVDPNAPTPAPIYVGTTRGIYKGTDNAGTLEWSAANSDIDTFTIYSMTIAAADLIYAGTKGNAIYQSEDGGASWTKLDPGLSDAVTNIQDLTAVANNPQWHLRDATAVNSAGQIVGYGTYTPDLNSPDITEERGFLLTPTIGLSSVDLSLTQVTYPDVVKEFTPVTYQITITNHGPDAATGIRITDWISPRSIFRYASSSYGECRQRGRTVRCEIGLLEAGQSALVNVSVEPQDKDIKLLNIARVTANERDIDFSNNTTSRESGITRVDRCFIATAAYGSFLDPHVSELRRFRDHYLLTNAPGRYLVERYYRYSPALAQLINEHAALRLLTQAVLTPVVYVIRYPLILAGGGVLFMAWWLRRTRRRRWAASEPALR